MSYLMDNPSARTFGDISVSQDPECAARFFGVLKVWEERLISETLQFFPLHLVEDGVILLFREQLRDPHLHHDVYRFRFVVLHLDIHQIRVDTKGQITWESPWSGGPGYHGNPWV